MENTKITKLEKIISKGQLRYILLYGVLGWGTATAILVSLLQHYFMGNPQTLNSVALYFVVFPASGILWGALMWLHLKNQYKKAQSSAL